MKTIPYARVKKVEPLSPPQLANSPTLVPGVTRRRTQSLNRFDLNDSSYVSVVKDIELPPQASSLPDQGLKATLMRLGALFFLGVLFISTRHLTKGTDRSEIKHLRGNAPPEPRTGPHLLYKAAMTDLTLTKKLRAGSVGQGEAKDCWFFGPFAAMVYSDSESVRRLITPAVDINGQKIFQVTLWWRNENGPFQQTVSVSLDRIPFQARDVQKTVYAQLRDMDRNGIPEAFPAIVENAAASLLKMFAKNGTERQDAEGFGYPYLDGGAIKDGVFMLTGRDPIEALKSGFNNEEEVWDLIDVNIKNKNLVILGIADKNFGENALITEGIPNNHVFAVINAQVDTLTGEKSFILYNPLGFLVSLSLSRTFEHFGEIAILGRQKTLPPV